MYGGYSFNRVSSNFIRVNLETLTAGLMLFVYPLLYGDSYMRMQHVIEVASSASTVSILSLLLLALLKPLAASLTLVASDDGGVASSIVAGALS